MDLKKEMVHWSLVALRNRSTIKHLKGILGSSTATRGALPIAQKQQELQDNHRLVIAVSSSHVLSVALEQRELELTSWSSLELSSILQEHDISHKCSGSSKPGI